MPARLVRAAIVLLLLALAGTGLLLQSRTIRRLGFDGENTVDEADGLLALRELRAGGELYHDYRVPPYRLTPYLPLFYWGPALVAKAVGASGRAVFLIGRLYVYVFWLGVGWMIYALARQTGCSRWLAGLAALLWFAGRLATESANSYRPDSPQLFFSLAALWIYQRHRSTRSLMVSVICLAAGFLHRHSPPVALLVMAWAEIDERRFGRAAALVSSWGILVGACLLLTQGFSGAFARNVLGNLREYAGAGHVGLLLELALWRGAAVFLGGVLAGFIGTQRADRLMSRYFFMALALAFGSSWKFGSGSNYYLEPFAAGCVLVARLLEQTSVKNPRVALGWLVVALVSVADGWATDRVSREQAPVETVDWDRTIQCLGDWDAPLLVEDGYLALRTGDPPVIVNASIFASLRRAGQFDDTALLQRIESRQFGAIFTTAPLDRPVRFRHFPPRWIAALRRNYRLVRCCGAAGPGPEFCVYAPQPAPARANETAN